MKIEKRPLYVDVYNKLYESIMDGHLKPGDKIPSEIQLAKEFSVGRGTVRQALLLLKENGLIYNIQGSGSYVNDNIQKGRDPRFDKVGAIPLTFSKESLTGDLFSVIYDLPNKYFMNKTNIDKDSIVIDLHKSYARPDGAIVGYTLTITSVDFFKEQKIDIRDHQKLSSYIDSDLYDVTSSIITKFVLSEAGEFLSELFSIKSGTNVIIIEEEFYNFKGEVFLLKRHSLIPEEFQLKFKRK